MEVEAKEARLNRSTLPRIGRALVRLRRSAPRDKVRHSHDKRGGLKVRERPTPSSATPTESPASVAGAEPGAETHQTEDDQSAHDPELDEALDDAEDREDGPATTQTASIAGAFSERLAQFRDEVRELGARATNWLTLDAGGQPSAQPAETTATGGPVAPTTPAPRTVGEDEWNIHLPEFVPFEETERPGASEGGRLRNTFTEPPASSFELRTHGYMDGKRVVDRSKKTASEKALYRIAGVNVFKASKSLDHVASKVASLREFLESRSNPDDALEALFPQFLVVCWCFKSSWTREHTSVVHLFRRDDDLVSGLVAAHDGRSEGFCSSFAEFAQGDAKVKAERLKFCFKVREAAPALKRSITVSGGEKPVLIAKKLATKFFRGDNYLEFDQDVGSSVVASMLHGTIVRASAKMIIDTAWVIEAKHHDELPERVFGVVRWTHVGINDICVPLDKNYAPLS